MAWQVGQFTVNVVLSRHQGPPRGSNGPWVPDELASIDEGIYRISGFLKRKDKWWHLKNDEPRILAGEWRPSGYDSYETVLLEAVADVSCDVQVVLSKLGVPETEAAKLDI